MGFIKRVMHPDWYHGFRGKRPFFEGWYYKMIDAAGEQKWVVIPGVFLSDDPHAFIQVLDGNSQTAFYHRYPLEAFWAADDRFEVGIGESRFTANEMILAIEKEEQQIHGTLQFQNLTPWPVTVRSPGIMGWYAWVPTMECYHGVVSLDHAIGGKLTIEGQVHDFSGGRGYIEKDWGKSFPSAWVWLQTNHFEVPGTSLTASTAIIPWRRSSFRGFIVGLWHENVLYRWSTYTGAKTAHLQIDDEQVHWILRGKTAGSMQQLTITATRAEAGILAGPSTVDMGKRVAESLTASVAVRLENESGIVFAGNGRFAGLEVHNPTALLAEK